MLSDRTRTWCPLSFDWNSLKARSTAIISRQLICQLLIGSVQEPKAGLPSHNHDYFPSGNQAQFYSQLIQMDRFPGDQGFGTAVGHPENEAALVSRSRWDAGLQPVL